MLPFLFAAVLVASPIPVDTPPPPPKLEQLEAIKGDEEIRAVVRLMKNGKRAPDNLVLPELVNRRDILAFVRDSYPETLRGNVAPRSSGWFWLAIDSTGALRDAQLLYGSGIAAVDSFMQRAISRAQFKAAEDRLKTVGVWMPLPIRIPLYDALTGAAPSASAPPKFTPYTKKPELLNRDAVGRKLVESYPPQLRGVGVGGTTLMWILVDIDGHVLRTEVKESSGYTALDDAAVQVARAMWFSPALNKSQPVRVWIQVPIIFQTH